MTLARFIVTATGPMATVQDAGRFGLMRFGVPASGPMDCWSFRIANAAIGNPQGAPAIEISTGGLTLDCIDGSVTFAVVGGGFRVDVGPEHLGSWTIATIHAGTRVAIRPGPWGSWTYLAFAGTLQTNRWLGSAATHALSNFGGGLIAAAQTLTIDDARVETARNGSIPCPVSARPLHRIRVVPGPQDRFFAADTLQTLLTSPFALTESYDRMGVRLKGPALTPEATLDMPSEAVLRGSVQVAGDGVATVLLADHQTTGGYPKIATVISADIDGFTQLRPRDRVTFLAVTPQAAVAAARLRQMARARYLDALAPLSG